MPKTSVTSAISATVDDVASILEGVERIAGVLNKPRSVVLIVENHTGRKLTRIWDHHDHGGYAVTPSARIAARGVNIYGSQNKANSIGTGTTGAVMYSIEGDDNLALYMYWKNPFIGANKCGAYLCSLLGITSPKTRQPLFIPYFDDELKAVATCGAGDQAAEMRFELLKGE
ncbi:MAG: hypothetical protein F6J97_01880 [Leptolyngbya sp. SIO4C1]|nr:hypothetical protein [Leptolyngbya sp. SIO4C1]